MCERQAVDGITHPGCRTRYSLDGLISFYRYDGSVKAAIKRLKYKPYLSELADIVIDNFYSSSERSESRSSRPIRQAQGRQAQTIGYTIVPVPLHTQRERERGFNQASLIGKAIANQLRLQFKDNVLRRIRNTKPQVELKGDDRRKNVVDAFEISPNILVSLPAGRQVKYPNILLIDDVRTTGSTLRACGNILKRAGAKKVWAMTIAR